MVSSMHTCKHLSIKCTALATHPHQISFFDLRIRLVTVAARLNCSVSRKPDRSMSSLIDIWTVELERIRAKRRAEEPFRPTASLGLGGIAWPFRARSDGQCSAAQAPCDDAIAWPAKEQADGPGSPSPLFVPEDLFLSILVDCFGQ
uniref:Uncharacterized protein n=1 Tax=Avena sativa TaxID=4498 RepID=A0ACD5WC67_AVESA